MSRSDRDFPREMGERVAALEEQVKTLQSVSHLTNASLEDTGIPVYDRDGQTRAVLGRQPDGSHGASVVEAGPQPAPSAPVLEAGTGTISVEWTGGLLDATARVPRVFGRVEVWAAPESGADDPTQGKRLGAIHDREGGTTPIRATPGEWRVWLRMVGPDGKRVSGFSQAATVRIDALVDEQNISDWINAFSDGDLPDAAYNNLAARLGRFIEVEAGNITANAIQSQHIAFGAMDGQIITAPLVQSHEGDQGWKLRPDGTAAFFGPDGSTQTEIDADGVLHAQGAQIAGAIMADSVDLQGALTVGGGEGSLTPDRGMLRLEGRMPATAGDRDMIIQGASAGLVSRGAREEFEVIYESPVPTGNRRPIVSSHLASNSSGDLIGDGNVNVASFSRSASGFSISAQTLFSSGTQQFWCYYIAIWGEGA